VLDLVGEFGTSLRDSARRKPSLDYRYPRTDLLVGMAADI
jgi:hypothetical protein